MFESILTPIIIAILFFLYKKKLVKLPDISGRWYVETYTNKTSYSKFKNMTLGYIVILLRSGNQINGTVEKIYEILDKGKKTDYPSEKKIRGHLEGSLKQNYIPFTKYQLHLQIVEKGEQRESATFYTIIIKSDKYLEGDFKSTAAKQEGTTKWQREEF